MPPENIFKQPEESSGLDDGSRISETNILLLDGELDGLRSQSENGAPQELYGQEHVEFDTRQAEEDQALLKVRPAATDTAPCKVESEQGPVPFHSNTSIAEVTALVQAMPVK